MNMRELKSFYYVCMCADYRSCMVELLPDYPSQATIIPSAVVITLVYAFHYR